MKKKILFLLPLLCACFTCGSAQADSAYYNGVKGQTVNKNDGSGGGIQDSKCNGGKSAGQRCDARGARIAICENIINNGKTYLSCVAKVCNNGFLLELYSTGKKAGKPKGICRTTKFAQEQCETAEKKQNSCGEGQHLVPRQIANPNPNYTQSDPKGAYQDCFCADTSKIKYDCGNGVGEPPTDSKPYTNVDSIIIEQNAGCTKEGASFSHWQCDGKPLKPGDTLETEEPITCIAQWSDDVYTVNYNCGADATGSVPSVTIKYGETIPTPSNHNCRKTNSVYIGWTCSDLNANNEMTCTLNWDKCQACNPGKGCTCDIEVKNNTCSYNTGAKDGYVIKSDKNSSTPQCVLANQQECEDAGGQWKDGQCKCNPDVPGAHFDIGKKECICDDTSKVIENGQCITPTKCPDDANGDYPQCTCNDTDKKYDENTNQCVCKDETQKLENGKCVTPTKCPSDANGDYPQCKCTGKDKIYNEKTNTCECPSDKPEDENGQCVAPPKPECPSDATGKYPNCNCNDEDKKYDEDKNECVIDELKKKRKAYEDAKANEQSTANKTLTALSTAATGIGGMELAQGLSEQSADKAAAADMAAYIETMRCTYGEGKQVKAGIEEIELPGANDQELMNLRGQYLALAQDLKERKDALGMKPGIESEEILDRSSTGLYDDENIGITGGNYASLYRAQVLESETDQEKIDDAKKTSKNRVIAGGVLVGAGVVGGIVGNQLINSKSKDKAKENESDDNTKEKPENKNSKNNNKPVDKTAQPAKKQNSTTVAVEQSAAPQPSNTTTQETEQSAAPKPSNTTQETEQSAAPQPSNTTQEIDETKIRKCIDEINKMVDPVRDDSDEVHIQVANFTNRKCYIMNSDEAADKLSEKFRTDSSYYKNATNPNDAPEACDVLEKLNNFMQEHNWDNDYVCLKETITVSYNRNPS